jgi:transposase-like protein
MPRHYPPHFRQVMIDRMLGGEAVLTLVAETRVPEQTLHRWKHQALIDAGLRKRAREGLVLYTL